MRAAPAGDTLAVFPSLKNRSVFVTGGGSGIGAAIVTAFAQQGARVAFIDVAKEASEALARQLADAGHARPVPITFGGRLPRNGQVVEAL